MQLIENIIFDCKLIKDRLSYSRKRLVFERGLFKEVVPDPTTTNKKTPSNIGPTTIFSSFFYD